MPDAPACLTRNHNNNYIHGRDPLFWVRLLTDWINNIWVFYLYGIYTGLVIVAVFTVGGLLPGGDSSYAIGAFLWLLNMGGIFLLVTLVRNWLVRSLTETDALRGRPRPTHQPPRP